MCRCQVESAVVAAGLPRPIFLAGRRAAAFVMGELSRRRLAETALIAESWFALTAATVLPLLLAYSLSGYSAILLQSLKS